MEGVGSVDVLRIKTPSVPSGALLAPPPARAPASRPGMLARGTTREGEQAVREGEVSFVLREAGVSLGSNGPRSQCRRSPLKPHLNAGPLCTKSLHGGTCTRTVHFYAVLRGPSPSRADQNSSLHGHWLGSIPLSHNGNSVLDILYMSNLTHLTFSVNQAGLWDPCPHFARRRLTSAGQPRAQLELVSVDPYPCAPRGSGGGRWTVGRGGLHVV